MLPLGGGRCVHIILQEQTLSERHRHTCYDAQRLPHTYPRGKPLRPLLFAPELDSAVAPYLLFIMKRYEHSYKSFPFQTHNGPQTTDGRCLKQNVWDEMVWLNSSLDRKKNHALIPKVGQKWIRTTIIVF